MKWAEGEKPTQDWQAGLVHFTVQWALQQIKVREYNTLGRRGLPNLLALRRDENLSLSSKCSLNSGSSKSHKIVIKFSIFYHHLSDERR